MPVSSSSRRRLGVALVLDPPVAHEIDGLRRALGDPSLGRIPAHLTLVPPVNVKAADLEQALLRLRASAAKLRGPLHLTLGEVSTFMPDNPVLYLAVGGDLPDLRRLRDEVFAPPLARELTWPWVPHVTLADGIEPGRITAAMDALRSYAAVAVFDRVVLLEERRGRVWHPLADAALERPSRIGTGGLALEITRGRLVDPLAWRMLDAAEVAIDSSRLEGDAAEGPPLYPNVLCGLREGELVAIASAVTGEVFVRPDVRRQGIGSHMAAAATRTRPKRTARASSDGGGR